MHNPENTPAIEVQNLSKIYASGTHAVNNLSLTIPQGQFFGLLGQNGAGKTTLLSILTSLVRKTSGKVWVHGIDIDQNFPQARQYMGIVPQEFNFMQFEKVIDIVLYQAGYYGKSPRSMRPLAEKLLKKLELWEKRNVPARTLSGGMKRRLMIARAMICQPKILILDEPTAGVDVEIRHSMWEYLQQLNANGTTIILTSHYLEEIEQLCERVAIIKKGKLLRDTSVEKLIAELPCETFLFDTKDPVTEPITLEHMSVQIINPHHLRVSLNQEQTLNQVFSALEKQGVTVTSMRTESNRLESLYLSITQDKDTSDTNVK